MNCNKRQERPTSKGRPLKRAPTIGLISMALLVVVIICCVSTGGRLVPVAGAAPIVSGYLNPWEIPFRHLSSSAHLRDPMPWEDGYFDPNYHAWPKSRQQQEKQSVKLASEQTMTGSGGGGGGSGSGANSNSKSGQ